MPEDFVDAMFRYENNSYSTIKKEYYSFALIIKWTNLKAVLAGVLIILKNYYAINKST